MSLISGEFLLAATVTITMVTVMCIIMQSFRISLKNIGKYWMVWIFIVPWGWILITLKILWLFFLHLSCEISQHPLNNLHRYSCFPEDESPWHFSDPLDHRKNFWIPVDLWMNCNNFGVPKFSSRALPCEAALLARSQIHRAWSHTYDCSTDQHPMWNYWQVQVVV